MAKKGSPFSGNEPSSEYDEPVQWASTSIAEESGTFVGVGFQDMESRQRRERERVLMEQVAQLRDAQIAANERILMLSNNLNERLVETAIQAAAAERHGQSKRDATMRHNALGKISKRILWATGSTGALLLAATFYVGISIRASHHVPGYATPLLAATLCVGFMFALLGALKLRMSSTLV